MRTDRITVNVGPHHPAAHGVLRMIVTLEGETVVDMDLDLGYLHRCHEKLAESQTYLQNMPFTDRLDYLCSMANNHAYALAVEKLADVVIILGSIDIIMGEVDR